MPTNVTIGRNNMRNFDFFVQPRHNFIKAAHKGYNLQVPQPVVSCEAYIKFDVQQRLLVPNTNSK